MPDYRSSFGAQLKLGDGASPTENFTLIGGVRDIDGLDFGNDVEEVTAHDTTNRRRQYVTTLRKGVELTFDIQFDSSDATHDSSTGLLANANDGLRHNYQLVVPDAGALAVQFEGVITSMSIPLPVVGGLMAKVGIQVTGNIAEI